MKSIAEWVDDLKRLDVQLSIEDDSEPRLRCNAPEGVLTSELRQQLTARKSELIAHLRSSHLNVQTTFPLSFAQQRLWFLAQLAPDNPFYNVSAAIRFTGTLDQAALKRSFDAIVHRHAALRTTFAEENGQPVQIVYPESRVELSIVNLSIAAEQESIIEQLATTEAQRPFNLMLDPLLRLTLLQFDSTHAVLLLTMHHIVADGWSLGVLMRELAEFYSAFVERRSPQLPALPIQYSDFACWQRNWLQGEILEQQLSYWREQLRDLTVLNLPADRACSAQTYQGATYPVQFSPALTEKLEALSQQFGTSLFMTLLAAFQALLYRYTQQDDIAIGIPIANRHRGEVEELIGFFVNSLVMRSRFSDDLSFVELLEQVRTTALEAYEHQDLPFEKLVEELDPERDLSRNPLFQVAFALQNAPMQPLELPGLKLEPVPLKFGSTRFDLEVHLWEPTHGLHSLWQSQAGLSGFISYRTDLFDHDRIQRLVGHFETLLEGIVANPENRLSDLPLLTAAETEQILVDWNPIDQEVRDRRCFHQIFEAQVRHDPNAIALVSEQGSLTYQELNQRADDLALILQQMGIKVGGLVGLCMDRSSEMVIGILGIWKAGGVYVPLDPNYPHDRLQLMLHDTQVSILLTQSWLVDTLPESAAKILCLDQPLARSHSVHKLATSTPDQLAYVIYTSGSTGTPKGVLLSHQGLCNVVEAQQRTFYLSRTSRVLQFSSLSFDASIFEIALAFGSGGTLFIPPKSAQLPGMLLLRFLQDRAITHALLTPAVLAVLPKIELPELQVLITGGEACSSQVIDRWSVDRHFFNAYGPTEATIWSTVAELHPGDAPSLIGHPIQNTQVYIFDADLNPVPVGISGEMYIGGEGIARGYLDRPELTAERFIRWKDSILYKTGDLARFRADGAIEFLGRIDNQIKIRGFRVELGEIETTLQRHPAVQDAAIITSGNTESEKRLLAYFSLNPQALREAESLSSQQIQHWQTLYNQTYQTSEQTQSFNTIGWNSSYTAQSIPIEQMQEWVNDRVQQILALKPKRILEIGCGTGLLLFQLAPHCEKYVATDFSSAALETIQHQLGELPHVELLHRTATDFEGIDSTFDLVILNSIVQYFPTVDYLLQVLDQAIERIAPGGVLFVGDVRNLRLLNAFHAWMQFNQADATLDRNELRQLVARSQFEEPELAIDPTFFYALRDRHSRMTGVQIRLSRGRSHNEMTQFRYNVLLHCDQSTREGLVEELPAMSIAAAKKILTETKPDYLRITNVSNSRVIDAVRTATWLNHTEAPKTVGQMRERLQQATEAIDPQDWWDLETAIPYTIEITWSTNQGNYDVLFVRKGVDIGIDRPVTVHSNWYQYTNNPIQSQFARQLIPDLRQCLKQSLPEYMIPSAFVPLAALPMTTNGKVDRQVLRLMEQNQSKAIVQSSSETTTESMLLEIWKDLLRLNHATIHENFFELGGHSLLATQLTSRVRDAFGLELPLKSVFEAPTIAKLAPILDSLRETSASKIPPLVRLDRSAYRQKRLTQVEPIVEPQTAVSWSPIVPLTLSTKPAFFCVHPLFGVVLPYLELADALKNDCSFYGLQSSGLDGSPPLDRIEAIASYYVDAIQTVQPEGPYRLGGWSFGGWVAYEMAQQLRQAGKQVELLAMIDTPARTNLSVYQSLKFLIGTALWSMMPFLLDYGALALHRSRSSWMSRWQWSRLVQSIPEAAQLRLLDESTLTPLLRVMYANAQAAYRYVPKPYVDRLTLFRAEGQAIGKDATLGWSSLVDDIQLYQVPGNHLSLLKSPHVKMLAEHLRECL
ncbi:non-ribosomal peptide synthetase [Leptolyngbya sp. NIES-2104]|uniref:non-ribosomal peptide synthetase n=1 Tax=Leptolyngbya sp. NIES-2104 TaxID=1552121 RepID=UPI0006EC6436|nr:non-ribosomal peptide synthetase [Leptolyngbya sp. NIES-2104]GAP93857.1 malonyl CoA-acyl carrier protein transacylase [Leptolyngbya sp. NIES-2104]